MKTAQEVNSPPEKGTLCLLRLAPVAWGVAAVSSAVLLACAIPRGERASLKFAAAVFAGCLVLWIFPFSRRRERRAWVSLFLLAFAVRLVSAVYFDFLGTAAGDPYAGSPDAWGYDQWARKIVSAWSELRNLNLHAYNAAGRWDVGFHYILAAFYAVLGESVLGGRVLVAFFGAAAVVFLYLVARRVADDSVAAIVGLLYAFWISSVAWSGYSVLRDSLVWALTLFAVWMALRVADGSALAGLGLFLGLVLLRSVRPYAAVFVVAGLAVAGLLALLRRSRSARRPALILAAAVLACEAVFFAAEFPNAFQMIAVYRPRQVLLKPLKEVPLSEIRGYPAAPLSQPGMMSRRAPPARHRVSRAVAAGQYAAFLPEPSRLGSRPGRHPAFGQLATSRDVALVRDPPGRGPGVLPVGAGESFSAEHHHRGRDLLPHADLRRPRRLNAPARNGRSCLSPLVRRRPQAGAPPAAPVAGRLSLLRRDPRRGVIYHRGTLRARGMVRLGMLCDGRPSAGELATGGMSLAALPSG